ncbi:outer membrane beta-barrel protein [Microbulbifer sp. SSSA005]|uniref:outer membrane beta-barrel protein n=1 Tax=unclassified Microbulbifer TaxID=2619833 RepID=UPI00403A730A
MKYTRLAILLLTFANASIAAEKSIYAGIGYGYFDFKGQNKLPEPYISSQRFGDHANNVNIHAGYQFNQFLSVELGYDHFGNTYDEFVALVSFYDREIDEYRDAYITDDETVTVESYHLHVIAQYPILNKTTVNALVGLSHTKIDSEFIPRSSWIPDSPLSPTYSQSKNETDLVYGIGVKYSFTDNFACRLQWKTIDNDTLRISGFDLSLETRF